MHIKKNWIYYCGIFVACELMLSFGILARHSLSFLIGLEIIESFLFYFAIKTTYQDSLEKSFLKLYTITIAFVTLVVIILFLFNRLEVIKKSQILLLIYGAILFFVNFFFVKLNKKRQLNIFIQLVILFVSVFLSLEISNIRFLIVKPDATLLFLFFDVLTFADFLESGFLIDFTVLFELLYLICIYISILRRKKED